MKGNITKQRIVNQSLALFNQFGVRGTSLSDVMRVTKLEKGGIYRHFESKEQIVETALRFYIASVESRLAKATEGLTSPRRRLAEIIKSFAGIAENPVVPGGCFIMNMAVDTDHAEAGPHPLVVLSFKRWERLFVSEIQNGIKQGEFREDVDAKSFAAIAICSIEGSIVLSSTYPGLKSSQVIVKHLLGIIDQF
ncbi:TetR/AcrR family transcriptional regulator [Leptospira ognonensis]|uniref:TetR/AcrR family transcriptional regulator n=1 Tax=Leptospira ognonensis TaxID=2484945 RepID=A0A4R9K364_9LEPT|nr:TetR/AcrR family transcriptional regulator [Leptospira ognonensis]TGL59330.1 TetR/AcrR family transcriptional regulator [Leptospira ognonensis]